jgi:hypothetical protein
VSSYLTYLEGQFGRKERNAPYLVDENHAKPDTRTQATRGRGRAQSRPSSEWQRAGRLLVPRSRFGPLFGVTQRDIDRAVATLDGSR